MGNYISRKLARPKHHTRVIFPSGEVRQILQPITTKAAELMVEAPNFFIINTKSLKIGKRFHPLNADDNLEKGNVYVMFPMQRKYSVVTASDMAVLFINANSVNKRASKGSIIRVLPESAAVEGSEETGESKSAMTLSMPRLSLEGIEEVSSPLFSYRMSMSRSKKPLLDTIEEEQACSR